MKVGFFGTWENRTNLVWYCRKEDDGTLYTLCWQSIDFPSPIVATIVVDLNRDGTLDILLQCEDASLYVIDGRNRDGLPVAINKASVPAFDARIPQVSVVSVSSHCGLPDIALVDEEGSLVLMRATTETSDGSCVGKGTPNFEPLVLFQGSKGVREVSPLSIASDDIDGDCAADLLYTVYQVDKNSLDLYAFFTEMDTHVLLLTLQPANHYGLPSMVDVNGDGVADIVFPICASDHDSVPFGECTQFDGIAVFYNDLRGSSSCSDDGCCKRHPYGFNENASKVLLFETNRSCGIYTSAEMPLTMPSSLASPLLLRHGDYNRDGYIDLLVPSTYGPLLLTNTANSNDVPFSCSPVDGNLAKAPHEKYPAYTNAVPFFVVLNDRGRLDIVLTYHGGEALDVAIYMNHLSSLEQNYFLISSTLNGAFNADAWGLYQPCAVHRFGWSDVSMHKRWAYATQLSRSQGHALPSPRLLFGLGRTFSYVEYYTVGIVAEKRALIRQWSAHLVPNSNLFLWLNPLLSPGHWRLRLYLVDSAYQRLLLVVLSTALGVIGIPIILLKWQEVRQDRRELKFR
ncbi:putative FG-GAP repeat protein [Trypanosoma grayi]|uniref:putative FG-GAP repeat protein n=1 Tax=Trypanosoma grayi TaxID=71804 RepID=UPI0004F407F2|nr:putative FG-GAP repeat protein [Trypanosoma grayi]KEG10105.1 putative FG-GAP repeat protein [Trypanosoma grayi]